MFQVCVCANMHMSVCMYMHVYVYLCMSMYMCAFKYTVDESQCRKPTLVLSKKKLIVKLF